MNEFMNSVVGRKFFDWTMPELVKQLNRLNGNLERLIDIESNAFQPPKQSLDEINTRIQERMSQINSEPKENN